MSIDAESSETITVASHDDGEFVFAGDQLTFHIDQDTDTDGDGKYVLRKGTTNDFDTIRTLDSSGDVLSVDTSDLGSGNYFISDESQSNSNFNEDFTFEVLSQDFSVSPSDATMENEDDSVTYEFSENNRGGSFAVNVTSDELSDDELQTLFDEASEENGDAPGVELSVSDGAERTAELADGESLSTGQYDITFDVVDSDAEQTVSLDVTKAGSGQIDFQDDQVSVESGDSENVTIEMDNTDNGYVHLGSEESGYNVYLQVTDGDEDGLVNLTVNTYGLETDETEQTSAEDFGISVAEEDSDDDVTLVNEKGVAAGEDNTAPEDDANVYTGDERLDAGNYQMGVSLNDDFDQMNNVGMLLVQERSTDAAQTWVTANDSIENTDELLNAIENDEVVQRNDVAQQDYAVVQVQASGVFGALENASVENYMVSGENNLRSSSAPFALRIEQTNPGQNADPVTLDDGDIHDVITSDDKNTVYYVIDTSGEKFEDGQEFNASFTVFGEGELNDDKQDQQVSTTFSVEKRTIDFDVNDDDVVEVASDENATISGETSIAPGSDVTLYVESEQGAQTPFAMTETVNVSADGTFGAQFDFSEQDVGTNFTIYASASPSFEEGAEVDGTVVSAASDECQKADNSCDADDGNGTDEPTTEEPTTDEPTTDEPSTDEPTTEEPTTDDQTSTDDTTETTTPGFGALVAVVALVGAALLAVRRE